MERAGTFVANEMRDVMRWLGPEMIVLRLQLELKFDQLEVHNRFGEDDSLQRRVRAIYRTYMVNALQPGRVPTEALEQA